MLDPVARGVIQVLSYLATPFGTLAIGRVEMPHDSDKDMVVVEIAANLRPMVWIISGKVDKETLVF